MDDKPTGVPSTPKYAWTILAIVFFLSIVLPMQWFSCPPLSANIFETYGLEGAARADFGLLMSYVAITALIAAVVAGPLANRLGHNRSHCCRHLPYRRLRHCCAFGRQFRHLAG